MKAKRIKRSSLPSFLTKLYEILENEEYHSIIHWSDNGKSFLVQHLSKFIDKVLPYYFKHSNFASFVRQLNMYDFHKSRNDPNECSFYHKKFIQGKKQLLKCIKRKVNHFSNDNEEDNIAIEMPQVNKNDKKLDNIIKRQNILEDKFNSLLTSSNDLNKEKEDRLNYEKNLQIILLLILNQHSKGSNDSSIKMNEESTLLLNCIENLDEDILNKLIEKSIEQTGFDSKNIQFSFSEDACTNHSTKEPSPKNKLFQLENSPQTNRDFINQKDKEVFNLTDEVNSVTQCLASTPTLSPPQTSRRYNNNEFNDIEMFPTPNQVSIYEDMIF